MLYEVITTDVASYFVVADNQDRLLRVETVPILNNHREFKGFILTLHDITQQFESDSRVITSYSIHYTKLYDLV